MDDKTTQAVERFLRKHHWLEIHQNDLRSINDELSATQKMRRNREFLLFIVCLLAISYMYNVTATAFPIELPFTSVNIPADYVISAFPFIIAIMYLMVLSLGIREADLSARSEGLKVHLRHFKLTDEVPDESVETIDNLGNLRFILLPSPLHYQGFSTVSPAAGKLRFSVEIFAAILFIGVPFGSNALTTLKIYSINHNPLITLIHALSLLAMLFSLIGSLISARHIRTISQDRDGES